MADSKKVDLPKWYKETRQKEISVSGNTVFTLLRLLDLPLQYHLLSSGLGLNIIRKLGSTPITTTTPAAPATALGLSPYHSLIWTFAVGAAAKQIYWCLFICDNAFQPGFSASVAAYNTLLNTVNTLLALWAMSSNYSSATTWSELLTSTSNRFTIPIGMGLYVVGVFVEWYCEVQRKNFKQDPANKGKLYSDGLFGFARNINYGGYTIWRVGYSIVCAGLPWGVAVGVFLFGDFANRAVPYLETHLSEKVSF